MGKKRINPSGAIVVGTGFIGFALFYYFTGIFTARIGWRHIAISAAEEPFRFGIGIVGMLMIGVALLIWGMSKSWKS